MNTLLNSCGSKLVAVSVEADAPPFCWAAIAAMALIAVKNALVESTGWLVAPNGFNWLARRENGVCWEAADDAGGWPPLLLASEAK